MEDPFWFKDLFEAALPFVRDALTKRINAWNEQALARKKKKAKDDHVPLQEIQKLVLTLAETATANVSASPKNAYEGLKAHLEQAKELSEVIRFEDSSGSRLLDDVYIHLDTYLVPLRLQLTEREKSRTRPLEEAVFSSRRHCLILGQPGAGKSTSMQRLFLLLMKIRSENRGYAFPILLRFRDLKRSTSSNIIFNALTEVFPLQFEFGGALEGLEVSPDAMECKRSAFIRFINEIRPVIILDGFDEYPDDMKKPVIAEELRELSMLLTKAKLVLTSRTGEFNYSLDNADSFEIAPLDKEQIETFARRWITEEGGYTRFLRELYASPFPDMAIKPLTLAHLCAIFKRNGNIPERPVQIYKKIVNLMVEHWDQQRGVKRHSAYALFSPDRKFDFLAHLGYHLTTCIKSTVFSRAHFQNSYIEICRTFDLPVTQAELVALELESHTGIFLQSGYDKFEFVHKSIQEYLTAEYVLKLPKVPSESTTIQRLGAEMAIVISMSSDPSSYIARFIFDVIPGAELPSVFFDAFVSRLLLERPVFTEGDEVTVAFFNLLTLWRYYRKRPRTKEHHKRPRIGERVWRISNAEKIAYDQTLALLNCKTLMEIISRFYYAEGTAAEPGCLVPVRRKRRVSSGALPYILAPAEYTGGPFGSNHLSRKIKNDADPFQRWLQKVRR